MGCSQGAVERAFARMKAANRGRVNTGSGKMRHTHSIDPVLFHNTRRVFQEKLGVDNVWDEPEFVKDCERWHPEIMIEQDKGGIVGASGVGVCARNRFGKVKERYVVRDGKLLRVI